jgi:glucose/arabinose dehydrogenase
VGSSVVEELRVASPGAEGSLQVDLSAPKKLLLSFKQPYANHNGGQVLFSPGTDPHLFVMFGDGGSGGDPGQRAQNTDLFFGKVLRLDVDSAPAPGRAYALPTDNPFLGTPGVRPEIWALGFRNPWRCSFDAANAAYFACGDVGQNAMEEVDLVIRGGNYGWPRFEGTRTYDAGKRLSNVGSLVWPALTYSHKWNGLKGASVTGGYFYRGSLDSRLAGKYIFADLEGRFLVSEESSPGSGKFVPVKWFKHACSDTSPLPCNSQRQTDIFAFGVDAANQLYFFAAATGLHRIVSRAACSS